MTEIDNLSTCKTVVRLSLLDNLVTKVFNWYKNNFYLTIGVITGFRVLYR